MASGGRRSGAGRPAGGISEARRMLLDALNKGLTIAGRERGLTGSDEEVAIDAAAQVTADMLRAGRGDEVLKLYALTAPKSDETGASDGKKSAILGALDKLAGPQASRESDDEEESREISGDYMSGTPGNKSGVPSGGQFFGPQSTFLPALEAGE